VPFCSIFGSGHVYLELTDLTRPSEDSNEVCLLNTPSGKSKKAEPGHIGLPTWLFGSSEDDQEVLLEKAKVKVREVNAQKSATPEASTLVCSFRKDRRSDRRYLLNHKEYEMLTCSADQLVKDHTALRWHDWHDCEHVQMVESKVEDLWDESPGRRRLHTSSVLLQFTNDSSDDSDDFDEDSWRILRSRAGGISKLKIGRKTQLAKLIKESRFRDFDLSNWYEEKEPLPQLVLHGTCDAEESDSEDDDFNQKQKLACQIKDLFPNSIEAKKIVRQIEWKMRKNQSLAKHVRNTSLPVGDEIADELNRIRESLGIPQFKHPQGTVCFEAVTSNNDIFFVAPCGFGKSACFTIPAVFSGGLTLVIEPYKALIRSQVESLQGMTAFDVENLLNIKEAQNERRAVAGVRLWEITKRDWRRDTKPLIIFSTPELVQSGWDALSDLSRQGILKRIVVDEFDVIGESNEKYRKAYLDLLPKLRENCRWSNRPVPIMALTATVTKQAIFDSLESANESSKFSIFLSQRALPDWHTYSVERKDSESQVRKS
jgi:hypothetical protein